MAKTILEIKMSRRNTRRGTGRRRRQPRYVLYYDQYGRPLPTPEELWERKVAGWRRGFRSAGGWVVVILVLCAVAFLAIVAFLAGL